VGDTTSVTPTATDIIGGGAADGFLSTTSPNFPQTEILGTSSAFPYLFRVGNKSITISIAIGTNNRWVHAGSFESLVTGPPDPNPIGQFSSTNRNPTPMGTTNGISNHGDGVVTRNPGLGVVAEDGAGFACLNPLHLAFTPMCVGSATFCTDPVKSFGATPPRWYSKVLMSQAVIHQSRSGSGGTTGQAFRGYYPELFAGAIKGTVEPIAGGVDSVIIDGVLYYWVGANCPGAVTGSISDAQTTLIAVRSD
jgi:hypothetical protein